MHTITEGQLTVRLNSDFSGRADILVSDDGGLMVATSVPAVELLVVALRLVGRAVETKIDESL